MNPAARLAFPLLLGCLLAAGAAAQEAAPTMRERAAELLRADAQRLPAAKGDARQTPAAPDGAVRLPDYAVRDSRATVLDDRRRDLAHGQSGEEKVLAESRDAAAVPPLFRDPGAAGRARLAALRTQVMDLEDVLLVAAHAEKNPQEAAAIRRLRREAMVLRSNVSLDVLSR
jgi:hypothetical protein